MDIIDFLSDINDDAGLVASKASEFDSCMPTDLIGRHIDMVCVYMPFAWLENGIVG